MRSPDVCLEGNRESSRQQYGTHTASLAGSSPAASPATRGQQIMAVAMEMASTGASLQDIAVQARTSETWARVALRLLREAPDIAQEVERRGIDCIAVRIP